jgi:uncharacterized membrane protein
MWFNDNMWDSLKRESFRRWLSVRTLWGFLFFYAIQASFYACSYVLDDPANFDWIFREKYTRHLLLVRTHGVAASIALTSGILQFIPAIPRGRIHRLVGRIYVASIVIASSTAFPMALMAEGGYWAQSSFILLSLFWFVTVVLAVQEAQAGRLARHREWMIVNLSLTFGAVLTRLSLNALLERGSSFDRIYPWTTWSWLITLAAGIWWIRDSRRGES